jgi:hypothetical protein
MATPSFHGSAISSTSEVRPQAAMERQHVPVVVTGFHPITKMQFRLDTWLFGFTESEVIFNAERMEFYQGMPVTLISRSNIAVEAVVTSVKQYSLSSQEVRLRIDGSKNHRPPMTQIFRS